MQVVDLLSSWSLTAPKCWGIHCCHGLIWCLGWKITLCPGVWHSSGAALWGSEQYTTSIFFFRCVVGDESRRHPSHFREVTCASRTRDRRPQFIDVHHTHIRRYPFVLFDGFQYVPRTTGGRSLSSLTPVSIAASFSAFRAPTLRCSRLRKGHVRKTSHKADTVCWTFAIAATLQWYLECRSEIHCSRAKERARRKHRRRMRCWTILIVKNTNEPLTSDEITISFPSTVSVESGQCFP